MAVYSSYDAVRTATLSGPYSSMASRTCLSSSATSMSRFGDTGQYLTPAWTAPPRDSKSSETTLHVPSPCVSPRHMETRASTPACTASLDRADPDTLASGTSRYMLSPGMAREVAEEVGLSTSIPFWSAYPLMPFTLPLARGPSTAVMPAWCSFWIFARATSGSVPVSSTTISRCQPAPLSARYALKSRMPSSTAALPSAPAESSVPVSGKRPPILTGSVWDMTSSAPSP